MFVFEHQDWVSSVSYDAKGERLCTGSRDRTSRIYSLSDGKELGLYRHPNSVNDACFSTDGARLCTACDDGIVRTFKIDGSQHLSELHPCERITRLCFNRMGTRLCLALGNGEVQVLEEGQPEESPPEPSEKPQEPPKELRPALELPSVAPRGAAGLQRDSPRMVGGTDSEPARQQRNANPYMAGGNDDDEETP